MDKQLIGYINACIAGDHRYSTRIDVHLDEDFNIEVRRYENGAVGGMDGPGGATPYHMVAFKYVKHQKGQKLNVTAKCVVEAIKELFDDTVKIYGKPTKRFVWKMHDNKQTEGLSVKNCQAVLESWSI